MQFQCLARPADIFAFMRADFRTGLSRCWQGKIVDGST